MNNPKDIWRFLAPILLEIKPNDIEMYVTVFHALELENEYQKKAKKRKCKNDNQ